MRVGFGFDAHAFSGLQKPLILGGEIVHERRGVSATSDGDVLVHALVDALLGAASLGDLGTFYPASDPQWEGASSMAQILPDTVSRIEQAGWRIVNVDATVIVESVRIAPHRDQMRSNVAAALGVDVDAVSVKATTTDGLGFLGNEQGVAATAIALLMRAESTIAPA